MKAKSIFLMILVAIFTITAFFPKAIAWYEAQGIVSPLPVGWQVTGIPTKTPLPDPKRPVSLLLLGYGGREHDGGLLTDTMILARVAPRTKKVWLISLPRDLWVSLPVSREATGTMKLNAAYAIGNGDARYPDKPIQFQSNNGGGVMAKYAVETITGIPVDYFAAFSFSGFSNSVDTLGGIDINVRQPLTDPFFPIPGKEKDACGTSDDEIGQRTATSSGFELEKLFPCRFETLEVSPGIQHLDGPTSLKYVRSRHALIGGGDLHRSTRQKEVIRAMIDKVFAVNFIPKAINFVSAWKNEIDTDMPLLQIPKLASILTGVQSYSITNIDLSVPNQLVESTSPDGQYILSPKAGNFAWGDIRAYIKQNIDATGAGILK